MNKLLQQVERLVLAYADFGACGLHAALPLLNANDARQCFDSHSHGRTSSGTSGRASSGVALGCDAAWGALRGVVPGFVVDGERDAGESKGGDDNDDDGGDADGDGDVPAFLMRVETEQNEPVTAVLVLNATVPPHKASSAALQLIQLLQSHAPQCRHLVVAAGAHFVEPRRYAAAAAAGGDGDGHGGAVGQQISKSEKVYCVSLGGVKEADRAGIEATCLSLPASVRFASDAFLNALALFAASMDMPMTLLVVRTHKYNVQDGGNTTAIDALSSALRVGLSLKVTTSNDGDGANSSSLTVNIRPTDSFVESRRPDPNAQLYI